MKITLKYLFFYSFLSIGLFACAQSKMAVKNYHAIFMVHIPGNIAVDKNGNEISARDTVTIVYVETSSDAIQWTNAWKNGKTFSIETTPVAGASADAGLNKNTNEEIILKPSKGNKLYKLRLIPAEQKLQKPVNVLPGEILLQANYEGKKITQIITKQTEVVAMPSV